MVGRRTRRDLIPDIMPCFVFREAGEMRRRAHFVRASNRGLLSARRRLDFFRDYEMDATTTSANNTPMSFDPMFGYLPKRKHLSKEMERDNFIDE